MIGRRLKEARKKANLKQEEVAEILQISRSNISKYETDYMEPNLQTLKELCQLYKVSADYLLGISDLQQKNQRKARTFRMTATTRHRPNMPRLIAAPMTIKKEDD